MKVWSCCILTALLWAPANAWSASESSMKLGKGMKYFIEDDKQLTLGDAMNRFDGSDIKVGESEVLSFGFSKSTIWFHQRIAAGAMPEKSVMMLEYALIDYIEFYVVKME